MLDGRRKALRLVLRDVLSYGVIPAQAGIHVSEANALGCGMLDGRRKTQNPIRRLVSDV